MKKVGVITWHYLENYGSALQAYAMKQNIEKFGYNSEIINYRSGAKNNLIYKFLRAVKYNLYYPKNSFLKRQKNFYDFRKKYLDESRLYVNNDELFQKATDYDIFLCGSDQIWAPNKIEPSFLLNFAPDEKIKISYAPSIAFDNFTPEQVSLLKREIKRFDYLSLREPYGVDTIKKITKVEGITVLDPSLLLSAEDYKKLIKKKTVKTPYILCYLLGKKKEHRDITYKLKEIYGYSIITLPFSEKDKDFGDIQICDAGPSEFLNLVDQASMICTDSFHGVLFSIIFRKEFYAFRRFDVNDSINQNPRVENIVNMLGLEKRLISNFRDIDQNNKIYFEDVYKKLEIERKKSFTFLENALKNKGANND